MTRARIHKAVEDYFGEGSAWLVCEMRAGSEGLTCMSRYGGGDDRRGSIWTAWYAGRCIETFGHDFAVMCARCRHVVPIRAQRSFYRASHTMTFSLVHHARCQNLHQ